MNYCTFSGDVQKILKYFEHSIVYIPESKLFKFNNEYDIFESSPKVVLNYYNQVIRTMTISRLRWNNKTNFRQFL